MENPAKPYFVSFGCWNNIGPDLKNVMEALRQLNPKPDNIFIAGDNYYPKKSKKSINDNKQKQKKFIKEELLAGFELLPKNIPIFMNYGNHDYENGLLITDKPDIECTLTKTEKTITNATNITLQMCQHIKFSDHTLVIMIDTTMYDTENNGKYKDCYKSSVLNDGTIPESFEDAKQKQALFMSSVVEHISENIMIRNIVIIGHHPIMNYKFKKNKETGLYKVIDEILVELAHFLYQELFIKLREQESERSFSYYYLCADLHQYQSGNIKIHVDSGEVMTIKQYIAGTGGADKDYYDPLTNSKSDISISRNGINCLYNMSQDDIATSRSVNGFLRCKEKEDNTLHFQFVDVNTPETIECAILPVTGGYKKHKRNIKKLTKKINKKNRKRYTKNL